MVIYIYVILTTRVLNLITIKFQKYFTWPYWELNPWPSALIHIAHTRLLPHKKNDDDHLAFLDNMKVVNMPSTDSGVVNKASTDSGVV